MNDLVEKIADLSQSVWKEWTHSTTDERPFHIVLAEAIRQVLAQSGEEVAWHTEDHLTDKSATTYSKEVADRWRAKGWPVTPHYTHPDSDRVAELEAQLAESQEREVKKWEAIGHYEDALLAECPDGATGWTFVSWNRARAALAAEQEKNDEAQ